jgi:PAS domain S-box/diguanylate cyclase (GGDEF) domain
MVRSLPSASLRLRLVLASVLVEIVMLALLVGNSVRLSNASLLAQAELRLVEVKNLLNASLAAPLATRDYTTLREILDENRRQEGIVYLVLSDASGKVAASSGWDLRRPLPEVDENRSIGDSTGRFDTAMPVELAGQRYGTLRFGVSTEFLQRARSHLVNQSLMIAFGAVLLSAVLLALVGFWLTRHLGILTRASESVAAGDFDVDLPVQTQDEVGQLTATFNAMAGAIRSRIEALQLSEEKQHQYLLDSQQEHARLTALLSAMNVGILFVSANDRVLYHNPAFLRIWIINEKEDLVGKPVSQVLDHSANILARPDHFSKHLLRVAGTHEVSETFEIHMADGRVVTQLTYPVRDADGRFIGRMWIYEDVTRERQTAEQLVYLAERDSLTGLFNRHRFQEELERMLAEADRRRSTCALLFFDLDEFKYINDTFGHRAGDTVLIRIAGEVGTLVRRNEVLSRLGGDEFAVLLQDVDETEVAGFAERVVRAVAQIPFSFEGQNLRLTSSVGIALYPHHANNTEDLIAHADTAMYQAKESGKNTWRLYRPDLDSSRAMVNRLSWNDRLSRALENDLLQLHFQGVYRAGDHSLSHLEALVRMADEDDPSRLIMPGHFIPFAEKSGKIQDIDRWVIGASIETLASSPDIPPIAVNISGRSFDDPTLPRYIAERLAHHQVKPYRLLVELTETSAVTDMHDAQRFIESLHQTGCTVCLDDFGTGFSSFAYLKHLDADILKIDGLFIRNLPNDHDNQVFVKAIVDVARGMNKITVAEFVEDEDILAMLKNFGVDLVQGYHLDTPRADHPALNFRKSA